MWEVFINAIWVVTNVANQVAFHFCPWLESYHTFCFHFHTCQDETQQPRAPLAVMNPRMVQWLSLHVWWSNECSLIFFHHKLLTLSLSLLCKVLSPTSSTNNTILGWVKKMFFYLMHVLHLLLLLLCPTKLHGLTILQCCFLPLQHKPCHTSRWSLHRGTNHGVESQGGWPFQRLSMGDVSESFSCVLNQDVWVSPSLCHHPQCPCFSFHSTISFAVLVPCTMEFMKQDVEYLGPNWLLHGCKL